MRGVRCFCYWRLGLVMKKTPILNVALIAAVAVWLLSLGLFLHLSQYDPYSWAFPGEESDLSRSLYLERRALYVRIGVVSFLSACVIGLLKILVRRRRRALA
jgi:hypothetical protein